MQAERHAISTLLRQRLVIRVPRELPSTCRSNTRVKVRHTIIHGYYWLRSSAVDLLAYIIPQLLLLAFSSCSFLVAAYAFPVTYLRFDKGGTMASARNPQRGPGAEPLVGGSGGQAPLKLKHFLLLNV